MPPMFIPCRHFFQVNVERLKMFPFNSALARMSVIAAFSTNHCPSFYHMFCGLIRWLELFRFKEREGYQGARERSPRDHKASVEHCACLQIVFITVLGYSMLAISQVPAQYDACYQAAAGVMVPNVTTANLNSVSS
jgi:hypothetical protein